MLVWYFLFFKQKTAFEMRIGEWSSDVCSADQATNTRARWKREMAATSAMQVASRSARRSAQSVPACGQEMRMADWGSHSAGKRSLESDMETFCMHSCTQRCRQGDWVDAPQRMAGSRSEEHTSELQSLMRISYAVFCLKKKTDEPARLMSLSPESP